MAGTRLRRIVFGPGGIVRKPNHSQQERFRTWYESVPDESVKEWENL